MPPLSLPVLLAAVVPLRILVAPLRQEAAPPPVIQGRKGLHCGNELEVFGEVEQPA